MDGPNLRALYSGHLPGILENLVRLYSEADFEVRALILRIRYLALASMKATDPHGMRVPLNTLLNMVGAQMHMSIVDPVKFEVLLVARAFAVGAVDIVELLEREPQAVRAVPPEPAHSFADILARFPDPRRVQTPQQQQQRPKKVAQPKKELVKDQTPAIARQSNLPKPGPKPLPPLPPPSSVLDKKAAVKVEKFEKKQCDHCTLMVPVDHTEQLKHMWKKHKEHVYKLIRPDLVCSLDYCDYVGSSKNTRKMHEGRTHGANPPEQNQVIAELKSGKCIYCKKKINTLAFLKHHLVNECKKRDTRPMLGCSACPKTFHFIYDFVTHLRINGGIGHGIPVHNTDT